MSHPWTGDQAAKEVSSTTVKAPTAVRVTSQMMSGRVLCWVWRDVNPVPVTSKGTPYPQSQYPPPPDRRRATGPLSPDPARVEQDVLVVV